MERSNGTPRKTQGLPAALEVHLLGLVDFDAALALQEHMLQEVADDNTLQGRLLVCEHPPLVTLGREASQADLLCDPLDLTGRQIAVRWVNRGGGAILHAPGQLALYPILPVERKGFSAQEFCARFELALQSASEDWQVPAWTRPGAPGLWTRLGCLAQVGLAIRQGVSHHGGYVNVTCRLDWQRWLQLPHAGRPTSIAAIRQRPTEMSLVRESLIRHLAQRFEYTRFHLYTGHPLLRRTVRQVAYA